MRQILLIQSNTRPRLHRVLPPLSLEGAGSSIHLTRRANHGVPLVRLAASVVGHRRLESQGACLETLRMRGGWPMARRHRCYLILGRRRRTCRRYRPMPSTTWTWHESVPWAYHWNIILRCLKRIPRSLTTTFSVIHPHREHRRLARL